MKSFKEHNSQPIPGAMFNFDGRPAKILSVSGGRVIVDFNNPLAGKTVVYDIEVKRKVEKIDEKVQALLDFFFRMPIKFEIKDKKLTIKANEQVQQFLILFKDKFKELLDLDLVTPEIPKNKKAEEKQ